MPPRRVSPFGNDPTSDPFQVEAPGVMQPETIGTPYDVSPGGGFGIPPTSQPMGPGDLTGQGTTYGSNREITGTTPPPATTGPTREQVGSAYQQYLGRTMNPDEYNSWAGNNDYIAGISGSPEARQFATQGAGAPKEPASYGAVQGAVTGKLNDPHEQSPKYRMLRALQMYGATRGNLQGAVDYYNKLYGGNAKVLSDDTIDMGIPGWQPVDVFNQNQNAMQWTMVGPVPGQPTSSTQSTQGTSGTTSTSGGGTPGNALGGGLGDLLASIIGQLGTQHTNVPTGPNLPGGYTPPGNVGDDPMSGLLDSALAGTLLSGGLTPFGGGVENALASLIGRGGVSPDIQQQIIGAREKSGLAQRSMLEDARSALADSGQLSEPGIMQGGTNAAVERIGERIAPDFASSLRDIYTHGLDVSNTGLLTALQTATGLSEAEANNILQAVGTGTQRQAALSNIALNVLHTNIDWQKFLAQHNLDQAKLSEDIQNGRYDRIVSLLQLFLQASGVAAGGYY